MLREAGGNVTLESVRDNWGNITDMTEASFPASIHEVVGSIAQAISDSKTTAQSDDGGDTGMNPERAKAHSFRPDKFKYSHNDAILYAISLGVTVEETDNLRFLYENNEPFSVIPTFGTIISQKAMREVLVGRIPGLKVDLVRLLHGEQYTELMKPLPAEGVLESRLQITDVLDKGSGAVLVLDVTTSHQDEVVMKNQFVIFLVGSGNFGGSRNSAALVPMIDPPKRSPDTTVKVKTQNNQAALYRLTGDINPLHIDPGFASVAGFDKPILHGLCSYGITCWQVIKQFAANDVTKFKAIKARFSKPVTPGQTLNIDMWKDGTRIFVETKVVESGQVALKGYVDLTSVAGGVPQAKVSQSNLASDPVFEDLNRRLQSNQKAGEGINAVFQWNITKNKAPASQWTLDLKSRPFSLYRGAPKSGKADTTLTIDDDDVISLIAGKLSPQVAFMKGKIKVTGNIMLSQKLQPLFKQHNKL
jgi:3-hydroxyacyl-CoA dehydrogenase/3a,7a,12a-trihydroxy-5b-cholest-24-enoyl-CoA hydratase